MPLRSAHALLVCLLAAFALAGCSTFERRAKQKAAVYDALPASDKSRLEKGVIRVGDNADMVYIALGKPHEMRERTNSGGQESIWIYNAYWQEYQGTQFIGYRRYVERNALGGYVVYYEPVEHPVYVSRQEERIRVTFRDGKVTVVEQLQP